MGEFFAEAQVLVVPNTADFAASLRAQLEAAVAKAGPVVVPVTAVAGATGGGKALAAETAIATGAIEEETVALSGKTGALAKSTVAEEAAAGAAVVHAKAAGQAERAIFAQGASIAGLRGAALTASAPFLAATVSVIAFGKSIKEASDLTEEFNKTAVVFGSSAKEIQDFSKTTASSFEISEVAALRAAGIFGNLFRTIHISTPAAADMSTQLVKLASDLASFNNADPSRVLEALRSGLVGQARPLRVFGIFISQARAQEEALIETGKKHAKELTNSELVQARFNIILKDSALAQGDFARTSDRLANQSRILKAELANTASAIGTALIPVLVKVASEANAYLVAIQKSAGATNRFAESLHLASSEAGKPSFLGNVFHTATRNFVNDAREISAAARLLGRGELVKFGEAPTESLRTLNAAAERTKESLPAARGRIAALFRTFEQGGGRGSETALDQFVRGLQKLQQEESKGLITNDQLAKRIQALVKQLQDPNAFKINLGITLDQAGLGAKSRQGAKEIVGALSDVLTPQAGNAIGLNFLLGVGTGIDEGSKTAKTKAASAGAVIAEQIALAQASGNQGAELQGLRAQAARQQAFLDRITARPQNKATVATATKAAQNLAATNAQIKSITAGIVADHKAAAADAKQKAREAATAQEKATQAFLDLFAPKQQHLQNRLTTATTAGNVSQEITINKVIISTDKAEIGAIKARIKHLKLHGAALKAARAAITTLTQEIFSTRDAIHQLVTARRQAIVDARQSHLEAQLSIAETTKTTKDDKVAEKALAAFDIAQIARIKAIKKRRKLTLDEAAQLDAYRVDLAQRNKALRDLKGTAADGNKAAKFLFDQLQAQQGFASNLLGNLITGSTSGLVGAPSPASASPSASASAASAASHAVPSGVTGIFPGAVVGGPLGSTIPDAAVQGIITGEKAKTTPGTTRGQHQTTNDILLRILHALTRQNRFDQAPEAHHQRKVGAAIMDNDGIHGI